MNDYAYINGSFVPREEAVISPLDRGYLYGDGFFETARIVAKRPFRLNRHIKRLNDSCLETGWGHAFRADEIEGVVTQLIARNEVTEGYLRITASRGLHLGTLTVLEASDPTLFIEVRAMDLPSLDGPPPFVLARASFRRDPTSPLVHHKSLSYQANLLALAEGRVRDADEVYFLNSRGELTEGAITNLFFVRDGAVHTPDVRCGLLPGITREAVMELCQKAAVACKTGVYKEEDMYAADEVFCTNSLRCVIPVKAILETPHKKLDEHTVTHKLQELYAGLVRAECGG